MSRAATADRQPTRTPLEDVIATLREGGESAIIAAAKAVVPGISARADYHDRTSTLAVDSFAELWAAGLTSLSLPLEAGGVQASVQSVAKAQMIIAAADGSLAFVLKAHLASLRDGLSRWPERLRNDFLLEVVSRPARSAGSRSDAKGGSAARGGLTPATAKHITGADGQDAWLINAHKLYATSSTGASWLSIWAATVPEDGPVRVGFFLVPGDAPGLEVVEGSWDQMGMRASASNEVVLRDVIVPFDHAYGLVEYQGADPMAARREHTPVVDWTSILEAATYAGLAVGARDWLVRYLNERVPPSLGAPLASLERFQTAVGEMELLIHANDQIIENVTRRMDLYRAAPGSLAKPVTDLEVGLVRITAVRNAIQAIDIAMQLIGNPGMANRNPLQRFHRDALCGRIHEPQPDVLLRTSGKLALELGKAA